MSGSLPTLAREKEITIRIGARSAVIWIVEDGGDVFIRSVRGATAKWYTEAVAAGQATIEAGGQRVAVRLQPAADPASVARASQAYLAKYQGSPYAASMVRAEILPTTLRVVPA